MMLSVSRRASSSPTWKLHPSRLSQTPLYTFKASKPLAFGTRFVSDSFRSSNRDQAPRWNRFPGRDAGREASARERYPPRQNNWNNRSRPQPALSRVESTDEIVEGTVERRDDYVMQFAGLKENSQVSNVLVDTITHDMGLKTMTPVQSQTINETLGGTDLVAQARTGTGKTLAFLIPILQNILEKDPTLSQRRRNRHIVAPDIRAIIISPTRELAEQIAAEAKRVTANTAITVQTAVGGTHKRSGLERIMTRGCHVLIGTPGRMKDILSDPEYEFNLSKVNGFVLDEADRLLDDGFFPDIQDIESYLPPKDKRHNMLFSATIPREVLQLAKAILKDDFRFVQTIQKGETQTHDKVPQKLVVLNGMENQLAALAELISREQSQAPNSLPFKALVFFNSNAETSLYAQLFQAMKQDIGFTRFFPVLEIHSRLTQAQRTRSAEIFRAAKSGIMFTSDVSARGMDYPNVSHVIQLGFPRGRDYYIHRVGRTGRGDNVGESWLIVAPTEMSLVEQELVNLPIREDDSLQTAKIDMKRQSELPTEVQNLVTLGAETASRLSPDLLEDAFRASLGHTSRVRDKGAMLDGLKLRCTLAWGMEAAPRISPLLAQKMGFAKALERLDTTFFARSGRTPPRAYGRSGHNYTPLMSRSRTGAARTRAWA